MVLLVTGYAWLTRPGLGVDRVMAESAEDVPFLGTYPIKQSKIVATSSRDHRKSREHFTRIILITTNILFVTKPSDPLCCYAKWSSLLLRQMILFFIIDSFWAHFRGLNTCSVTHSQTDTTNVFQRLRGIDSYEDLACGSREFYSPGAWHGMVCAAAVVKHKTSHYEGSGS